MEFTESELRRLLWLRAIEWANWPAFLAQPMAPILFIFLWWPYVLVGGFVLDILWTSIRYSYVNIWLANSGAIIVTWLKWPAAIGAAIYLFIQGSYIAGVLALIWPWLAGLICIPAKVGQIELAFAKKIGYIDIDAGLGLNNEGRKRDYVAAIEKLEETGGEEGIWLSRGFKNLERGMQEQAINAFNEVLNLCGLANPKMAIMHWGVRFKDKIERDGHLDQVSLALLGFVLSYSALAQFDEAKEYLGILERINPNMAEEFRKTWRESPPHA